LRLIVRDHDLPVLIAFHGLRAAFTDGNRGASLRAKADGHDTDALLARAPRFGHHVFDGFERLPVTHEDEGAIGARAREEEENRALADRLRQRTARLSDDGWIEVVEEEVERARVDRERRHDV